MQGDVYRAGVGVVMEDVFLVLTSLAIVAGVISLWTDMVARPRDSVSSPHMLLIYLPYVALAFVWLICLLFVAFREGFNT